MIYILYNTYYIGGVKKTFWILLTVACCCALIVHTYSLISRFSQFPVTTEVTVVNTKILDFPGGP